MTDPRLCSVHLEALPRRQEFRRARELLYGACGQQTLAIDQAQLEALRSGKPPPSESHFRLQPFGNLKLATLRADSFFCARAMKTRPYQPMIQPMI